MMEPALKPGSLGETVRAQADAGLCAERIANVYLQLK